MTRIVLGAVLSHWRKRPWQLFILIAGLSMATALWTGVQAINAEAKASYANAAQSARMIGLPQLQRTDGQNVAISDFAQLRRLGVKVTPVLSGSLWINDQRISVLGIDPISHPLAGVISGAGGGLPNDWFTDSGAIFVGPNTPEIPDGPVRVIKNPRLAPGQIVADISVAARLLGRPNGISSIGITGEIPVRAPDGFVLVDPPLASDVAGLTDSFHLNLTAFGGLSFVVGLFILYGGIGLAFEQRRPMFRTMRALGVPLRILVGVLAVELLIIALVAGTLGVLLGYGVAAALLPDVSATLSGLYGAARFDGLSLRPSWIFAGLFLSITGTGIAGISALIRVASMPMLAPAMPEAWARKSRQGGKIAAISGIAIGAVSVSSGIGLGGLEGAFIQLGGLLLAGSLVLPFALSQSLSFLSNFARKPLARWFWADTQSQLPGLSLALMALMLALAANTGVTTMVHSFRAAFDGFLDQRLVSDFYINARSNEEAELISRWLAPRVDAVLPIWHADTVLDDRPAEIYGIVDQQIYREKWPMLTAVPQVWEKVLRGDSALVSEQLARRSNLRVGDTLALDDDWQVQIAGTYADYGNPGGQVVVALPTLLERHPEIAMRNLGILTGDHQSADLVATLISEFGLPATAVRDRNDIRQASLMIFDRTFAVTAVLNVLTLGVAGFAILTSLLTLANMRLPQLAPIWAMGLTRATIGKVEIVRAMFLAALTFVYALPLGLGLAWMLLRVVNAEAFGWQLPVQWFPGDWAKLFVLAIGAGCLSAAFPALRIARMSAARLTQVFAHER